jgi:hypothetical protein
VLGIKFSGIDEEKHKVLKNPNGQSKRKVGFMMYNCMKLNEIILK